MALTKSRDPAFAVQLRVLKALILRDIRTRFFGNGLGYVVIILWPLTHIVALLAIAFFAGRRTPLGDSLTLFFATALVPALSFRYMSRFVPQGVIQNRPLTAFPIVKYMDLILARCITEAAAFCCVAALLAGILFFVGDSIQPEYPVGAALAFLATMLLALGFGAFIGVIAIKVPKVVMPVILIQILAYITSGVLFIPSALPDQVVAIISWNPVLHAVEWMRESYYLGYQSKVLDKEYLLGCGLGFFSSALLMERAFRSFLTRQ